MCPIFSQRKKPKPDTLNRDLPQATRKRIVHSLQPRIDASCYGAFDALMDEMQQLILEKYGDLDGYSNPAYSDLVPALRHWASCPTEKTLDFLELLFHCRGGWDCEQVVETVNTIFREDGIGYELSPYRLTVQESRPTSGVRRSGPVSCGPMESIGTPVDVQLPRIVEKGSEYMHEEVIRPCLDLLTNPKFKTANEELLKAHKEYREGNYADAITDCGAAFETVMKTICTEKKWTYDKGKATCKDLVDICKSNGLFEAFYAPFFIDAGTIRNKLGDAHGKGQTPEFTATKEHFEHMVQITSANILLFARLANI
jgi:hypothetical protein